MAKKFTRTFTGTEVTLKTGKKIFFPETAPKLAEQLVQATGGEVVSTVERDQVYMMTTDEFLKYAVPVPEKEEKEVEQKATK